VIPKAALKIVLSLDIREVVNEDYPVVVRMVADGLDTRPEIWKCAMNRKDDIRVEITPC